MPTPYDTNELLKQSQNLLNRVQTEGVTQNGVQIYAPQGAITPQGLAPTTPITPVIPQQPVIPDIASLNANISKLYETPSQAEAAYTTGRSRIEDLTRQLAGEGTYRTEQEDAQQVAQKRQTVADLSGQLKQIQAEQAAIPLQIQQDAQGRGVTAGGIAPIQTAALRNNAIRALSVGAQLQAAQGNLSSALDLADRAVAAKYDSVKAELAAQRSNLDMLLRDPSLTRQEKERAAKAQVLLEERDRLIKMQEENQKTIQGLALQAAQNGAPAALTSSIMNATDIGAAMQAGAGWLQKETAQSIQEYNFAVRNGYKGSYTQYQNEDANRKAVVAKAGAAGVGQTGLSIQQYNALNQITTKFQADPIINQSLKGATAVSIADQIIANPQAATSQLKSLYVLVKNLDPDSAVREGELALANQTQSYFQQVGNVIARIGEGRVVSPEAAVELAKATKELMTAWNETAAKRQRQYTSQANTLGLGNEFGSYVSGAQLGYNQPIAQPQAASADWLAKPNYNEDIRLAKEAIARGGDANAIRQRLLQKYKSVEL